tara:strand:+ start:2123 stop:2947 length:825 start_codon:yes stop_codon:yes gene_type:complete
MVQKNILASILINNYNNKIFFKECIKSCLKQSYENIEIIVFDDASNDGAEKYLKNIKNKKIKKILNHRKISNSGAINQLNAIQKAFLKSRGEVIFLLDGDDVFLKNKVRYFISIFEKNKSLEFTQDNPIYYYPQKKLKEKKIFKSKLLTLHTWPYFNPTSTMIFRRNFLKKLLNEINFSKTKYQKMFFDARAFIYIYFFSKNFTVSNKYLTLYTQNIKGDTIKNYASKNFLWWQRRQEYHKFVENLFFRKKKKHFKLLDYYLTLLINWFYQKFN